ncbi:hypothetical protein [Salinicoccus halitifaciens]|uniref:Uncharacterized protein n=1 Tax=Salinicoccus halitifaciens TaxID=1073415 RepID=A0ABV2E9A8_9STAP|nr:hypothetical protein [Salinicoccus halitifaciens]MCD2137783.1 hypothetical protein [Salinicoccus halitifaciens]
MDDYRQIYHLTDRIFKVAVAELNSPDDLLHWLHLYELMDRVDYHYDKEVVSEIKHEARSTSDLGHLSRSRHKKNDSNF